MTDQQEYIMKLNIIEQEAQRLEQQMQVIDQQIQEMQAIKASIEDLDSNKDNNEMLANLGKGILIKTEIKSKDLFVNVGKNIIIKKDTKETIGIIDDQMQRLVSGKQEVLNRIEELQGEMQMLITEAQNAKASEDKGKEEK